MLMTPNQTKPRKKSDRKPMQIKFPPKIKERLVDASIKLEKPQSQIILDALREHLNRLEEQGE